jgi:hypothetical protein
MREDEIIARGHRARNLLADDDVQQAFADVEAELFAEWRHADTAQERESLHATFRAHRRLHSRLQLWADELTLRKIK